MTVLTLGSYSVESRFHVIQHNYMGGETGYRQVLEVVHPDGSVKFLMHERGHNGEKAIHRFSEWQTLQHAGEVVGIWPDANERRLKERPGFVRFIDLGNSIPWFYAREGQEVAGDAVKVEPLVICDGCNVREPFEHRCHGKAPGSRIKVADEWVNHPCQCRECPP